MKRREFIKRVAQTTAAVSAFSAQRVLGANERVGIGVIGFGLVGRIHTRNFHGLPNSQVVADPSLATYGTYPRNFLRGPGYVNFDLAFAKTTAITERLKLEFRAEFFNIFNHANFLNPNVINNGDGTFAGGAPGTNINSGSFGQITGTYDPRIVQFGLRLAF